MESMKLVEVAPLTRKVGRDVLTYFSSRIVSVGDIVEVSVRGKNINALVLSVRSVKDLKTEIRNSSFGFKKILGLKGRFPIYKEFLVAVQKTSEHFIGNFGQTIAMLVPAAFLENFQKTKTPLMRAKTSKFQISAFQGQNDSRIEFYKKEIQKSAEEKKSVFIASATIEEARGLQKILKTDLKNVFLLYGAMKEKTFLENYKEIQEASEPVVIVGTPAGLFIPRHDLGLILMERENSSFWQSFKRPFFDARIFATNLARELGVRIVFCDKYFSVEMMSQIKDGLMKRENKFDFHIDNGVAIKIIDMKDKKRAGESFVLAKDCLSVIKDSLKTGKRTFIFALRKGLATQVVCHDCREVLSEAGAPLILSQNLKTGERILRNAFTMKRADKDLRCPNCGSWNFDTLGIGTERVAEELKKFFPKAKILRLDSDAAGSVAVARATATQFYETPGAILVGTEMAFQYLSQSFENTILASFETLFNIGSFKINEKIFNLIATAIQKSQENVLIQTRTPTNSVLSAFEKNDLMKFYDSEIGMRKKYNYPPFSEIIKITHTGNAKNAEMARKVLEKVLVDEKPNLMQKKMGNQIATIAIAKIPPLGNEVLRKRLATLTPDYEIRLNPERLF